MFQSLFKLTPRGINFNELWDTKTGYVHRFKIYARESDLSNRPTDVVIRLMDPLLDRGYHLFTRVIIWVQSFIIKCLSFRQVSFVQE